MTYRAIDDIFVAPHVRACRPGDIVPDSVVEALGCYDKVRADNLPAVVEDLPEEAPEE